MNKRILIIQTASLGDVILSTALAESLHTGMPDAEIHYLVKKGYQSLFKEHPFIGDVLFWDKSKRKYVGLFRLMRQVRHNKYDAVINVQRFASSGLISLFSGAKIRSGFKKNPLSLFYTHKYDHIISAEGVLHEVERNQALISTLVSSDAVRPALYPSSDDVDVASAYSHKPYITVSPASLWFTKQYPEDKWIDFLNNISPDWVVLLLGSAVDKNLCERIKSQSGAHVVNLAGALSFLQSAALMKDAVMNYVNDSAPMHLASSVNAPVAAIFCSTVPAFGFGPLSDNAHIVEINEPLYCRPCGIHGYKQCPEGHFKCALQIQTHQLTKLLP